MFRCNKCGETFHEAYTENWDVGSCYADIDLCPRCHSEFIMEIPWEQAEILERREHRKQTLCYYEDNPAHKPADLEERYAREEAEDEESERILREVGDWV